MTREKFQIFGTSLTGHGLAFDIGTFGISSEDAGLAPERAAALGALVDTANAIYKLGRASAQLPYDDRFDLHCTVDTLRALSVIIGPTPTGDRYRRCGDIIARLLQEQGEGP